MRMAILYFNCLWWYVLRKPHFIFNYHGVVPAWNHSLNEKIWPCLGCNLNREGQDRQTLGYLVSLGRCPVSSAPQVSCCETHSNDTTSVILVRIEHEICSMSCRYQQNVPPNYSNLTIQKFISTVLLVTRGCKSRREMWTDVPQLSEGHKKITAEQITRTSFPLHDFVWHMHGRNERHLHCL